LGLGAIAKPDSIGRRIRFRIPAVEAGRNMSMGLRFTDEFNRTPGIIRITRFWLSTPLAKQAESD
jgi:hypothetical protein